MPHSPTRPRNHSHRAAKKDRKALYLKNQQASAETPFQTKSSIGASATRNLFSTAVTFFTLPTVSAQLSKCFSAPNSSVLQLNSSAGVNLTEIITQCGGTIINCPGFMSTMIQMLCDNNATLAALSNTTNITIGEAGLCAEKQYNLIACDKSPGIINEQTSPIILIGILVLCLCCSQGRNNSNSYSGGGGDMQERFIAGY